jgi:hypothetical protein
MQLDAVMISDQSDASAWSTSALCDLAARGLVAMLDPNLQVFCNIYMKTESGMVREGVSHRYTTMTLLGLHRYEKFGGRSPVKIDRILNALLDNLGWVDSAGDLGLLLWTCAELAPERVEQIYAATRSSEDILRFPDSRLGSTMEMAWYLTGLAACATAGHRHLPGLKQQIDWAAGILKENCGTSGLYGHRGRGKLPGANLRHRIGSFADQVYPTIAFSKLALAYGDEDASARALRTATRVCELQGPRGEWPWQYDAALGRVISFYPVYSVHQHAMAPMMLFAASEASGRNFDSAIAKGLAWIRGNNELSKNFIEPTLGIVWRCIYLEPAAKHLDAALRFLHVRNGAGEGTVKIRYECRPYELGWLLYAFAGRDPASFA